MQRTTILRLLVALVVFALATTSIVAAGPAAVSLDEIRARLDAQLAGSADDAALAHFPLSVASGDPRPSSVVLWTRVHDADLPASDLPVELTVLEIVSPERLVVVERRSLLALASDDHVVKVRVDGLAPGTRHLYFFSYVKDGAVHISRIGRTKTAPAPGGDVPVRFATINCQDFVGRYYNAQLLMTLEYADELDFVALLGDTIYETTGDPDFQTPSPDRDIVFDDEEGAIRLGDPDNPYFAARSLDNYRQLHRIYRADRALQAMHEAFPVVVIWDDHEYSDDNHGATATFFAGRRDELDVERKRDAERAFFEYMPIEIGLGEDGVLDIGEDDLFPNTRIYQSFSFGRHLDLFMTDYRTYRPDHLISEDAFPGAIAMDRAALELVLGAEVYAALRDSFDPYLDVDADPALRGAAVQIATAVYLAADPLAGPAVAAQRAAAALTGNQSVTYLRGLFDAAGLPFPLPDEVVATLDTGLSYVLLGKREVFSDIGSRFLVPQSSYELLAGYLFAITGGESENAYGSAQEAWLREGLSSSAATWKVVGNSVSSAPLILDFTNPVIAELLPPEFPDDLRTRLQINADHWDGFPNKRRQLFEAYARAGNTVLVSGDIHASFVADHGGGIFEFTSTSASSETFREEVRERVESDPTLSQVPGIDELVDRIDLILAVSAENPDVSPSTLEYANTLGNGFVVVEAAADAMTVTYREAPATAVFDNLYDEPDALRELFATKVFRVREGELVSVAP